MGLISPSNRNATQRPLLQGPPQSRPQPSTQSENIWMQILRHGLQTMRLGPLLPPTQASLPSQPALGNTLRQPAARVPSRPAQLPVAREPQALPPGVDWRWIGEREGPGDTGLNGYVPPDRQRNSGVTIAHGLDLGQRNAADLQRMGLSPDLIRRLTPYLGYRGQEATDYVRAHPLTITRDEQDAIDRTAFNATYQNAANAYNNSTRNRAARNSENHGNGADVRQFSDLPIEAQTVIADVAHQYGNLHETPNFLRQVTNNQWREAIANLRNFGDETPRRRQLEADRLQRAYDEGRLPGQTRTPAAATLGRIRSTE